MTPNPQPTPDATRSLMLRYLDGSLPQSELEGLNASMKADVALRREFAALLLQEVQLAEIGQQENAFVEMRRESVSTSPARVLEHTPALEEFPAVRWLHHPAGWSTGLALAACIVIGLFLWTVRDPIVATLATASSGTVVERKGQPLAPAAGLPLRAGDRVSTPPGGTAGLQFAGETTSLRLQESTVVQLGPARDGKHVFLDRGTLNCTVSPQPAGMPMRIETPQSQASVLGTQFRITSLPEGSRLDVWSGRVRFQKTTEGGPVEVWTGQFAVAREGSELVAQSLNLGSGTVLREYWVGVPGEAVTNLEAHVSFPQAPTGTDFRSSFEAPTDWGDNYGTRMRGYLRPPLDGEYTFWIEGADSAQLWMSLDERIGHSVKVAEITPLSSPSRLAGPTGEGKAILQLKAGGKYYIEAMHKAGRSRDRLAVYWELPQGIKEVIPGAYLSPYETPSSAPAPR